MARSIKEIKTEIGQNFVANENIKTYYSLPTNPVFEDEFSRTFKFFL